MEEQKRKEEEEIKRKEDLKLKEIARKEQLATNPLFEYQVIVIQDLPEGQVDYVRIQGALDAWSKEGWRLHSIFSSEVGKVSSSVSIAGFGSITNATIDQTILVFERCIKA